MHCKAIWRDPRITVHKLADLTLTDVHVDNRYLWKTLPVLKQDGCFKYPLICWRGNLEFWNKFIRSYPPITRERLPTPAVVNNEIIMIKGGNNRYQAARDLGYDTIDCIVFDTQDLAIRWMHYIAQCDPLNNPHLEYRGLIDYK